MQHQQNEPIESVSGQKQTGSITPVGRRISIRMRLSLVLGLLLGLTFMIVIVAYSSLNSGQQAINELMNGDAEITGLAQQAEITMLQMRRSEKDYLLRYKAVGFAQAREIYVQSVSKKVGQFKGILDALDAHGVETGNLRQALARYQARFLDVVGLYEKRGHIDKGLEGKFRTTIHEIEKMVRAHDLQLLATVLQMRRHEKDYLLRGHVKYIDLLHQSSEVFKASVKNSADASRYITLTNQYVAGFDKLVVANTEIGNGIALFRSAVHQLEPEFDALVKQGEISAAHVKRNMQHAADVGKRWVLSIGALALLLGIASAIFLARSITRPVATVTMAAHQFASGDLTQRVPVVSNDEISDLAQSFNEMAEELQRSIRDMEQFAYVASHDLQEPLRMVASYTELLAKRYQGQLDERADKYIHYATDGAKRMQTLIDALLTYSRVGTRGGTFSPVDAGAVAVEAVDNLTIAIAESHADITVGQLPVVIADRIQLSQVLQNLIGNAIKYRGEAAPVIRVTATQVGGTVQFTVTDNGIGIAPEFHERIFQIFQRLHERGLYEGTGLGLALVKKIVERHGGKIWLQSEENKGAAFHFTLPASSSKQEENHDHTNI